MASIDINIGPIVDAVAAGVRAALEGVALGVTAVQAATSNGPREPWGEGHAGWGAAGAPVVFEVYEPESGGVHEYWGMVGNVLWRVDEGGMDEPNGWHRVRISRRMFFAMYVQYCRVARFDGDMQKYQYEKPVGT